MQARFLQTPTNQATIFIFLLKMFSIDIYKQSEQQDNLDRGTNNQKMIPST